MHDPVLLGQMQMNWILRSDSSMAGSECAWQEDRSNHLIVAGPQPEYFWWYGISSSRVKLFIMVYTILMLNLKPGPGLKSFSFWKQKSELPITGRVMGTLIHFIWLFTNAGIQAARAGRHTAHRMVGCSGLGAGWKGVITAGSGCGKSAAQV